MKVNIHALVLALACCWIIPQHAAFADDGSAVKVRTNEDKARNRDRNQDALDKAGFGRTGAGDKTQAIDPHAKLDQYGQPRESGVNVQKVISYTYLRTPQGIYQFNLPADSSLPIIPRPDSLSTDLFTGRFVAFPGNTVVGLGPSATDGIKSHPSEPFFRDWENQMNPFRYSGDTWGDCLGPNCLDRAQFRNPLARNVQFTHFQSERRNDLSQFLGFPDTESTLSASLGTPVKQMPQGKE